MPRKRCATASSTRALGARAAIEAAAAAPRLRPLRRALRSPAGARPQPRNRARDRCRHLSPDPASKPRRVSAGFIRLPNTTSRRLIAYPGEILELGRSCVDRAYRQRPAMQLLWSGIAAYVFHYNIGLMFGCASLPGTDPDALAVPLSYLYHHHLAAPALRPRALPDRYVEMRRLPRRRVRSAAGARRAAAADQGISAASAALSATAP